MLANWFAVVFSATTSLLAYVQVKKPETININWLYHISSIAICTQTWIITTSVPTNQVAALVCALCFAGLTLAIFSNSTRILKAAFIVSTIYYAIITTKTNTAEIALNTHILIAAALTANLTIASLQTINLITQKYSLKKSMPPAANFPAIETLEKQLFLTAKIGFILVSCIAITSLHNMKFNITSNRYIFNIISTTLLWITLGVAAFSRNIKIKNSMLIILSALILATVSISCILIRS
ncbi:MAG: hypothetical protein HON55_00885 [Legionellales bacterium]|jgi:ABC-type uncharacterized transport system permease subunit|nr:hypothetical protein [Legionellales bacterium]